MPLPTLTAAATLTLEKAINHALTHDPATQLKLQQLAGQSLAICLTSPAGLALHIQFLPTSVACSHNPDSATTRLSGSLPALLRLLGSQQVTLAGSGVSAEGSTHLLTQLNQILAQTDIDWEGMLSQWLGDIGGQVVGQTLRKGIHWGNQQRHAYQRQLQEFLTEELRATPSQIELANFNQSVDTLRLETDRLAARIRRVQQQLSDRPPPATR